MADEKPDSREPADPPWARMLFGDDPWPILLLIVAVGFLLYFLAREALPAILGAILIGLVAHAWLLNREKRDAHDEEKP